MPDLILCPRNPSRQFGLEFASANPVSGFHDRRAHAINIRLLQDSQLCAMKERGDVEVNLLRRRRPDGMRQRVPSRLRRRRTMAMLSAGWLQVSHDRLGCFGVRA